MQQSGADGRRHKIVWFAIIVVGAWMVHPVLTPAHVEGFSASIVSLALHLNAGHLADYDRLHAANLEYFALSRLGTVTFLSVLTGPLHLTGEWAIRMITWLGLAALVASSFALVRRWTGGSRMAVVVSLLLIPGVVESSFYYNDTIFAAALGTSALAVLSRWPSAIATVTSGLLFGAAVLARLDAVLLAPAVILIGYEQHGLGRTFWSRALVFALGVLAPVATVPSALHATIFDVLSATRYAVSLWGQPFRLSSHARELSFFLGIPAGILAALGCLHLARRRDHGRLALLLGVPTLFNLVVLGKVWQSRQMLPMTPFLAALIVLGWRHVEAEASERGARALRWTVIAVCGFAWLAPTLVVRVSDGPRAPYGRLWTPVLWTRWQDAVRANQAEIRALVESPADDSMAIITDTWNGDRYLHLALQDEGYQQLESDGRPDACEKTAETFAKGDRRILHIRLRQPFLANWRQLAAARLESWAAPCVARWKLGRLTRLAPLEQLQWSVADSAPADVLAAGRRALAIVADAHYSPQLSVRVLASELGAVRHGYDLQAEQEETFYFGRRLPAMSLQEAERLMAPRVWKPPAGPP